MADLLPGDPWVLVRRKKPVLRFPTLIAAQKFYDQLRFNAFLYEDAAVFGPNGEAWYCQRYRDATWVRDDARRKREAAAAKVNSEEDDGA
jgi:hypothetical protein